MGGKHPTGMHSWLQGMCVVAGACMVVRGHVSLQGGGGVRGCGGGACVVAGGPKFITDIPTKKCI